MAEKPQSEVTTGATIRQQSDEQEDDAQAILELTKNLQS